MTKKSLGIIQILVIIFVPGMLTLFIITNLNRIIRKIHPRRVKFIALT